MIKRFRWMILAVLVVGAILWRVLAGGGQKGELPVADPVTITGRESSRHKTGDVEKHLATPLEKKVAQQERKVEDRRKVLPGLAKAKGPVYLNPDGAPQPVESPEEIAKRDQAARDFEDARREYLADREVLEKLKLELAEEQKSANPDAGAR